MNWQEEVPLGTLSAERLREMGVEAFTRIVSCRRKFGAVCTSPPLVPAPQLSTFPHPAVHRLPFCTSHA